MDSKDVSFVTASLGLGVDRDMDVKSHLASRFCCSCSFFFVRLANVELFPDITQALVRGQTVSKLFFALIFTFGRTVRALAESEELKL